MINQWSTVFGPISNPSVFEVFYLVKYFGGFKYFISHDIKNRFKKAVTLFILIQLFKKNISCDLGNTSPTVRTMAGTHLQLCLHKAGPCI